MGYVYKNKLRRTLMDMHIEDWHPDFLSKFSPEEYFESLKIMNVNAPMIYIQSHVGLCYWPTKTGRIHKSFIGKEDATKRLFDLCHGDGMSVVAYYSLIYNNWAYKEHPEWRMRDVYGKGSRDNGKRYGLCCPNNTGYRNFVKAQMAEFCDYFEFEGIFLDMTFWPMICYCDACKARWEKEAGGEMPVVVDWNNRQWNVFQQKRSEWLGEFALDMTAEIKKHKPECAVEHQYSTVLHMWRFGVNENISKASDYAGGDLYGGLAEQSFSCKLYYNLTQNQPFEYMTSRCYPELKEHTTTKSIDQIRTSIMLVTLHHGACLMIDAIDPIGSHDRRIYESVGKAYAEMKTYEKYLVHGEQAYDVGIYFNLNAKMDVEANGISVGTAAENSNAMPHFDASFGAAESLRKHHISYTVLNNWKLELLSKAKVLILADVANMSAKEVDAVREYVIGGGNLYMSGHSAPELVEEFFGGKLEGLTRETITYISPTERSALMDGLFTRQYPLTMFERAFQLKAPAKGEVLATLTLPYTIPNPLPIFTGMGFNEEFLEEDDPRYKFASIHANPPGIWTDYPALLKVQVGAGSVIWSCVPFEKADRFQHSMIFARIISSLIGEQPVFSASAPETVEIVVFDAPERNEKYVGMINLQESFNMLPVFDIEILVAIDSKPKKVIKSNSDEPVDYVYQDGTVTIRVPELQCFDMFTICC